MYVCMCSYREILKRRELLEKVRFEERRMAVVSEAQEMERELKKKENRLLETEPES